MRPLYLAPYRALGDVRGQDKHILQFSLLREMDIKSVKSENDYTLLGAYLKQGQREMEGDIIQGVMGGFFEGRAS